MRTTAATVPAWRWRSVPVAHGIILGLLLLGLALELAATHSGLQHGLLIGAALLIKKHFGSKSDDADGDVQGEHAVTRCLFRAANAREFDGVEDVVSEDFRAYANGYAMYAEETDRGPELLQSLFEYWQHAIPDARWELYDEAADKRKDKSELVVIRFVVSGTIEGKEREIEIAAFARVVDERLSELRLVTDLTIFNEYRAAIGLPILD